MYIVANKKIGISSEVFYLFFICGYDKQGLLKKIYSLILEVFKEIFKKNRPLHASNFQYKIQNLSVGRFFDQRELSFRRKASVFMFYVFSKRTKHSVIKTLEKMQDFQMILLLKGVRLSHAERSDSLQKILKIKHLNLGMCANFDKSTLKFFQKL